MKCKCGGNIEQVAFNCDYNLLELYDCMCSKCGHKILAFPKVCKCGGILEFNYINEFIDSGSEDKAAIVLTCSRCLKDYLSIGDNEDIAEYENCIKEYENMEG